MNEQMLERNIKSYYARVLVYMYILNMMRRRPSTIPTGTTIRNRN